METFAEQREHLLQSIEDCQNEVSVAMHELTGIAEAKLDLGAQARALIRQRPVVAVLAAVGVGYLLGHLVSRASRRAT